MKIINYLISVSLLVLSVVKTAEIFTYSDKKLKQIQKEFIKTTLKSHQGSISLVGANLVLVLSGLFILFINRMQIEYKEALYRKDSYLCSHYLNTKTLSYIQKMLNYNISLRAAYIAIGVAPDKVLAKSAFNTLKLLRDSEHFIYLKKLSDSSFCSPEEISPYLLNLPFKIQSNLALITKIDETTIIRNFQWSLVTMKPLKRVRFKNTFCIKSNFSLIGEFSKEIKLTTTEHGYQDQLKLKCLSG